MMNRRRVICFRIWSALTCQRFVRRRLVAAVLATAASIVAATSRGLESGNKLPHSKNYLPQAFVARPLPDLRGSGGFSESSQMILIATPPASTPKDAHLLPPPR